MIEILLPENYSSAYTGALYSIDKASNSDPYVVEVIDSAKRETLGFRRVQFLNNNRINIARYLSRVLNPQPLHSESGWVLPEGRSVEAQLLIDDEFTPSRIFTASLTNLTGNMLLSNLTHRTVTPHDIDEISLFAEPGVIKIKVAVDSEKTYRQPISEYNHSGGLITYNFDVMSAMRKGYDPEEVRRFWLYITLDNKEIACLRYSVIPITSQSVRLGWLNPYGAVDYHTFRSLGRLLRTEKDRVVRGISVQRVSTVRSTYAWEEVLSSGYLPLQSATAMSSIFSSPRVWRIENGEAQLVDVTEEMVTVSDEEQLSTLRFSVREAEPHQTQFF